MRRDRVDTFSYMIFERPMFEAERVRKMLARLGPYLRCQR